MVPEYYLILAVLLLLLALLDLVVGVSNDAVNFLNSAIGSQVASRKTILIIASLGIFLGAAFSSGMMEIARKGIFNPEQFVFAEVMVIFLAVMITDILLLDLFNTLGLPTSTTVSIVFELLGAAVAIALLKILASGGSLLMLGDYINSSSALTIISGIFASIAVAFLVGSVVQYFSRVLFSFHIEKRLKWVGALWSGLALSCITYFLLFKGIKGASFVSGQFINWVGEHVLILMGISFVVWALLMQVLQSFFSLNILKVVVLFGTFSLAMAFAGNDLVNFIGAPIAGLESYLRWDGSGIAPEGLRMDSLNAPIRTNAYWLFLAGMVMILTLWFSKKAQSVTETEVSLGRQDAGLERFQPNALSKWIVRNAMGLGQELQKAVPDSWLNRMEENFKPIRQKKAATGESPAFDLLRASVNLTVASMLIAFATSLKLPLSTTYVSFMVAMGTSMADRAWGRDSAVFRVTGVLNVISGWFVTALIAFAASGVIAILIFKFKLWAVGGLVLLLIGFLYRSRLYHQQQEIGKAQQRAIEYAENPIPAPDLVFSTAQKVSATLNLLKKIYSLAIQGLANENSQLIAIADNNLQDLRRENELLKLSLYRAIQRIDEPETRYSRFYILLFDLQQDMLQSTSLVVEACKTHVDHKLSPPTRIQMEAIQILEKKLGSYLKSVALEFQQADFEKLNGFPAMEENLYHLLDNFLANQTSGIKTSTFGFRNSTLFFSIILETRDLVEITSRILRLYRQLHLEPKASILKPVLG